MKILRAAGIILVGAVFIFSGAVKGIDPVGSAFKFHDYFQAFGMGFLSFTSLPLAVALCLSEFLTGFAVLTGIRRSEGIWGALILMGIFTPLTFLLALTNPVSDCGCFGDAIHLTNWQTFGKNIIILFFVLILFIGRKNEKSNRGWRKDWSILAASAIVFTGFIFYNLLFLPVIDFLPYSTGTSIPSKMKVPDGAPLTTYETTFIYEKAGKTSEFTLKNYPANDTSWKFVEQKSRIVSKGFEPAIHDFSISTTDNRNLTDSILNNENPVLLMITRKIGEADPEKLDRGFEAGKKCLAAGMGFYILTASGSDETGSFQNGLQFCLTDETTLKTMMRSNPGYILLSKGVIQNKWSWANLPDERSILKKYATRK